MKENLIFKAGDINILEDIFKLYVDARKTKGCTWTEEYPTKEIIKNDILRGDSFVIVNEKNNEIIAAISIDDDKLVEEQECWSKELKPAGELARLVIAEEYRGNGLAGNLIQGAMENLQKRKYKGVHYLVSPNNANALRAYKKMEFNDCGRIFLYDHEWICYERGI